MIVKIVLILIGAGILATSFISTLGILAIKESIDGILAN